jgi:hypothetical protein
METQESHRDARWRISEGIRENIYTLDRLVGAPNAFDFLPTEIYKPKRLSSAVKKTFAHLTLQAKALKSPLREELLNNLGLMKGLKLRDKIEARFNSLPPELKMHSQK